MSLDLLNRQRKHSPDILDCLAHLSSDEVFTPPLVANQMLDNLPEEVWSNPDLRWLDPACKTGVFLREAARRLMDGLKDVIPDEDDRRNHIFKNMLFGIAITELTGHISRRSLYYSKDATYEGSVVQFDKPDGNILQERSEHIFKGGNCTVCGAPESLESRDREGLENYAYTFIHSYDEDMQFDVIIGNPPYQLKDDGHGASASPIYHLFVEKALSLNPRYISFIIPARWYAGGKGLDSFRKKMVEDRSLKVLVDCPKLFDIFPGVEIKGGICYFLRDNKYEGDCEVITMIDGETVSEAKRDLRRGGGILIRSNEAVSILEKVQALKELTLETKVSTQKPFGFRTFFKDYKSAPDKINNIQIYRRDGVGWVSRKAITKNTEWIDKYKVLVPKAGDGHGRIPAQVIGNPLMAKKESVCTETYLVAGVFATEAEAQNYSHYIAGKFARFLISLRKNTQDTKSGSFAFVPDLDMKRKWTDKELYERYDLTEEEIAHIEATIKEMSI